MKVAALAAAKSAKKQVLKAGGTRSQAECAAEAVQTAVSHSGGGVTAALEAAVTAVSFDPGSALSVAVAAASTAVSAAFSPNDDYFRTRDQVPWVHILPPCPLCREPVFTAASLSVRI